MSFQSNFERSAAKNRRRARFLEICKEPKTNAELRTLLDVTKDTIYNDIAHFKRYGYIEAISNGGGKQTATFKTIKLPYDPTDNERAPSTKKPDTDWSKLPDWMHPKNIKPEAVKTYGEKELNKLMADYGEWNPHSHKVAFSGIPSTMGEMG